MKKIPPLAGFPPAPKHVDCLIKNELIENEKKMRLIRDFVVSSYMLKIKRNSARRLEGEHGVEICARLVGSDRQRQKQRRIEKETID